MNNINQKIPEGWNVKKLGDVVSKISRRNIINNTNVVTISAQKGFINQEQFFNKSVAGSDLTNYYLLEKGDFGYNRSYSKGYPTGAIKRVDNYDYATVSTLYICFRPLNKVNSDYLLQYFETGLQHFELYKIVQEGARNHGLLNVSLSDFFNIKLLLPPLPEQEKIAGILGTWDEAIEKLSSLIEQKKLLKKGLMQRLLIGKTRLSGFTQPWKEVKLGDILHEHLQTSSGNEVVCSVSVHKGVVDQIEHLGRSFSAANTSNYNLVHYGDVIYTKSPTGDFPYGIFKQSQQKNDVIVSPLYGVFTPSSYALGYILDAYFSYPINMNNYLRPIIQKGAKNTINITNKTFLSRSLFLPTDISEQKAIAAILSTADDEINLLNQKLEALKTQKKGLMQQLLTGQIRVKVN